MFAFTGFQSPVDHNDNKGKRHVGVAIYGALILCTVIYLLLQGTAVGWWQYQPNPPHPGNIEWTVLAGSLLSPLTNALLFITLARIVLTTSAENMKMEVAGLDLRKDSHASIAVFAFGVACLFLGLLNWTAISDVKSVIYVFVYSFAAISCSAYWRAGELNGHKGLPVLAPLSFAVATLIAYYAGFPALVRGYVLVAVVAIPMFLAKRRALDHNRSEHLKRSWWFFEYLGTLLVISGFQYAVWLTNNDPKPWYSLFIGDSNLHPFSGLSPYQVPTHEFALLAAAAGVFFYLRGTRKSEDLLRSRQRQNQAKHPHPV